MLNDDPGQRSGPRTLWEFLDKWLHKLGDGGQRLIPLINLIIATVVLGYIASVAWRIWLISHALDTFGVDIVGALPVDPHTAEIIHTGLKVLVLFFPDAIITYGHFYKSVFGMG